MRREQRTLAFREEHVRDVVPPRVERRAAPPHPREVREPQRVRERLGIARELRRRGVREELALTRHRALHEPREEDADRTDEPQEKRSSEVDEYYDRDSAAPLAALAAARNPYPRVRPPALVRVAVRTEHAEHTPAEAVERSDPGNKQEQAEVEPHVAVEDVAVFVRHHSLQLVPLEEPERARSDAERSRVASRPGYERIDVAGILEHPDGRHGHARCDGHLLADVEKPETRKRLRVAPLCPRADHLLRANARHQLLGR